MEANIIQLDMSYQRLSQNEVNSLPNGSIVYVLWSGANGPCRYSIKRDLSNNVCVNNIYNDNIDFVRIDKPKHVVWLVFHLCYELRYKIAAMEYHYRTEFFDQKRCIYRNDRGIAIPKGTYEYGDCTKNASYVFQQLCEEFGMDRRDFHSAIKKTVRLFEEEFARLYDTSQRSSRAEY